MKRQVVPLLCLLLLLCLLGGCAQTPASARAERIIGNVHISLVTLRDMEHQVAIDALARGDTHTAEKAAKVEEAAAKALPFVAIAKEGLAAVRGDPEAQARVLTLLTTQVAGSDPYVVAAVAILQPLIQELLNEAQGLPGPAPSPPPTTPAPPSSARPSG